MDWTASDQENLLKLYEKYGNKWKKIGDSSEKFTEIYKQNKKFFSNKIKESKGEITKLGINCPKCKNYLDSNHLLLKGLWCVCGCPRSELIKTLSVFPWVTYIVQEKSSTIYDSVEYVGHSEDFNSRHSKHPWLTDDYIIRISLVLGENYCISLFKPKGNVHKKSSKNKIRIKENDKYIDKDLSEVLIGEDKLIVKFLKNPGYYANKIRKTNCDWCYDKDIKSCTHSPRCYIRKYRNLFYEREPWYPIPIENISELSKKKIDQREYNRDLEADPFDFEQMVYRSPVEERTIKNYITIYKNLVKYGLWNDIKCPSLFLKNCSSIYSFSTLNNCCKVVMVYIRCMSPEERSQVFGKRLGQRLYREYSTFMIIITGYCTEKAERKKIDTENEKDYLDIVQAIKDLEKEELDSKLLSHLILMRLYIYNLCLRTDYNTLKIRDFSKKDNFIDIKKGKLVFNDTVKIKTTYDFDLDEKTLEYVKELLKLSKQVYLVEMPSKGIPYDNKGFSRITAEIFSKYVNKKMNIRRVRNAVATYKRKDLVLPGESREIAKNMNHSESMSKNYYNQN